MSINKITLSATLFLVLILIGSFPAVGAKNNPDFEVTSIDTPVELQSMINPENSGEGLTWLGGDVGTSIKTSPNRYIWLFGDTLLGKLNGSTRKYSEFIHNSIGVMERRPEGTFKRIKKYYGIKDGDPKAIFASGKEKEFYWPLVGVKLNSSLLVASSKVSTKNSHPFNVLGTTLFNIDNPEDEPDGWEYSREFLEKKNGITWGTAVLVKGEWLYLFGQKGSGLASKMVLSKIKVDAAEKGKWGSKLVFVNGDWKKDSHPTVISGLPGTSETTIQHNSFFGWYCVQIPPFSYKIHLYTAQNISGPWKDQGPIYSIPSPWSTKKNENGKHLFIAYAAKSHPELAGSPDELVITYNTNLNPFVKGLTDKLNSYIGKPNYADLYIPQLISVKLDKSRAG